MQVARKNPGPGLAASCCARRTLIGPATVASMVMMAIRCGHVLLAFGLALALRVVVVAKFVAAGRRCKIQYWPATLDLLFPGLVRAFLTSWSRAATVCMRPCPDVAGPTSSRLVIQGCINAGLLLCGAFTCSTRSPFPGSSSCCWSVPRPSCFAVRRVIWRYSRYRQYEQGIELRNLVDSGNESAQLRPQPPYPRITAVSATVLSALSPRPDLR